jgi:hypothetical protein
VSIQALRGIHYEKGYRNPRNLRNEVGISHPMTKLQILCTLLVHACIFAIAHAQELEPRAYSPAPIGTNFLLVGYGYSDGSVLTDPSAPVTDVSAQIQSLALGYGRALELWGRSVNLGIAAPYYRADVEGNVQETAAEVTRRGMGDARFRLATNIIGGEALTREEFATKKPATILGTSLSITAPTGAYNSERLINIGLNRWVFKPEVGVSQTVGDFFLEGSAGVSFFTDNQNYFGNLTKEQDPLGSVQFHGGYTFLPGLWLAVDGTYYFGGRTTLSGRESDDLQANSR